MNIIIEKLTDITLLRKAIEFTMYQSKESKMSLETIYRTEHSPIRTQLFWVEMYDIPTFVSVHFVRHNIGINHFVSTRRNDRGADEVANRDTLINHAFLCNAQALIQIARKRLCTKSHPSTQLVMNKIRQEMQLIDPYLAKMMVPECQYRNGYCPEQKPCRVNVSGAVLAGVDLASGDDYTISPRRTS